MPQAFTQLAPGVFRWADTCNAYVIKDGSAAILIDLGDSSVLDALPQIGVSAVEWVLFTHHRREQCQGFPKLTGHPACRGVKIAAPAAPQLAAFQKKLRRLEKVMKRGWEVFTFAGCDQDRVSRPAAVPHLWQVSPHLYKVRGHECWPNFHMLVSDDGHAILIDCGLFDRTHLDRVLDGARDRLGIKQIDVDRLLADGEVMRWRGHLLACDWMPGQTEFTCCVHGEIDGKRVAFTGDNVFGSPADPAQHGHEAVVARNACTVEDGYGYAGRYLHGIAPDLILGGHSWAIENPGPLIERYMAASDELRAALADLTTEKDYRLWFDPYWARVHPNRVNVKPGLTLAAIDITHDGQRRGQLFDMIVNVGER